MNPDKLTYMANQIATAFAHLPAAEAETAIADHIDSFWDPRMRAALLSMIETGAPDLSPRVAAAATRIRKPAPV